MVFPYKYSWQASFLGAFIAVLTTVVFHMASVEHGLELATLWTGRISSLLFLPVFVARPLMDLLGPAKTGGLLRHRSGLGQILAGNHHVHMILLTVFLIGQNAGPEVWFYNPGFYIYFILIFMHISSFPSIQKKWSKSFVNRLHWIGLYALGAAFFQTLVLSVLIGDEGGLFRCSYTALFFAALAIRVLAFVKSRRATPKTSLQKH